VLASFARVCDLITDAGEVAALVWDGGGNGPLNVVLEREPGVALPAGARFVVKVIARSDVCSEAIPSDARDCFGAAAPRNDGMKAILLTTTDGESLLDVNLSTATPWEARPDWEYLRARRGRMAANVRWIEELLAADAARRSNGGLSNESLLKGAGAGDIARIAQAGQAVAAAYRSCDHAALAAALAALCGLGPGLTPAGDDWLAGWLLAHHCSEDLRGLRDLEGLIVETAAARTTTLSRAFLAAAAAGEADESWHELLSALASEAANQRISEAADVILAHGATSGAAMLMGFVAGVDLW